MKEISQIAKAASVSDHTVKRILSGDEKIDKKINDRVKKAAEQLGYNLEDIGLSFVRKRRKQNRIGVIVPDISDPVYTKIINGIRKTGELLNYRIFLQDCFNAGTTVDEAVKALIKQKCDGIIFIDQNISDQLKEDLEEASCELFLCNVNDTNKVLPSIQFDQMEAAYDLTKKLIKNSSMNIAIIVDNEDTPIKKKILDGILKAVEETGNKIDDSIIFKGQPNSIAFGEHLARDLIKSGKRVDLILCQTDLLAAGVINTLKENHIDIPDETQVAGFDDGSIVRQIIPTLSTVSFPYLDLGATAVRLLIKKIENKVPVSRKIKNVYLPHKLVIG